jgi:hypothetical protein
MGKALKEWATILYAAFAIALEERRLRRDERRLAKLERNKPAPAGGKRGDRR